MVVVGPQGKEEEPNFEPSGTKQSDTCLVAELVGKLDKPDNQVVQPDTPVVQPDIRRLDSQLVGSDTSDRLAGVDSQHEPTDQPDQSRRRR